MGYELTLSFTDARGEWRAETVRRARYTIGRAPGNDLALNFDRLSRQHAVIEVTGDGARLSDCGSRNGTTVNGRPVTDPVELRDGDRVTLGNVCELQVRLVPASRPPGAPHERTTLYDLPPNLPAHEPPRAAPPQGAHAAPRQSPALAARYALVVGLPLVVILLTFVLLYALTRNRAADAAQSGDDAAEVTSRSEDSADAGDEETNARAKTRQDTRPPQDSREAGRAADSSADDSGGKGDGAPAGGSSSNDTGDASSPRGGALSDEQVAHAVRRVMGSMSTDDAPYISEAGVRDVAAKVRAYGAAPSAVAERLRAMRRSCADVSAQAQRINLRPSLLMYAALAETEGGADPASAARQMSQKLLTLRATFGTDTANSALLLLAAYPYPFNPPIGTQQRTVHPLYAELIRAGGQRSRVDPSVARSVWFLREHGHIRPEAYDLVLRTLALGVIAQNPQRYGVNADPLLC